MSIKSQAKERLGVPIYLLGVTILLVLLLSEFLENIFLEGKRRTDQDLIYQIGNPTLGALSYFHVGVQLGGIWIKPGMVLGHGWVERGSSQVIQSSNTEVRSSYELLMLVI